MKKGLLAVLALALLMPAGAWSQQKGAIELKTTAEVEVVEKNQQGEKTVTRVDVAKAIKTPGDTVVFTTVYSNTGAKPATDIVINNPVPEHMSYLDKSAEGGNTRIDFSADNGKTFGAPDKLKIKNANGTVRPALGKDYTHIRWTVISPLASGGTGTVSYKARIK
jgi:uncharacterized repeat protein (TIGR01451 family)